MIESTVTAFYSAYNTVADTRYPVSMIPATSIDVSQRNASSIHTQLSGSTSTTPSLSDYISSNFVISFLLSSFFFFFFYFIFQHFLISFFFFFFNDTAPPEIYPLPLHDPLPI